MRIAFCRGFVTCVVLKNPEVSVENAHTCGRLLIQSNDTILKFCTGAVKVNEKTAVFDLMTLAQQYDITD